MSSGGGPCTDASDFFRFFTLDLNLLIELELGSDGSGMREIFGGGEEGDTGAHGGEQGGNDEGGDIDVMSTMSTESERERARLSEECELGEGESSGAGGGGRLKWNVREAICICDLDKGELYGG